MRILGIDPGSRVTGFGIVEWLGHRELRAIVAGTFDLGGGPLSARLLDLHERLNELVGSHHPAAVAIEGIFSQRAPRSALILAHARGVALLCAAEAKLPVHEYPPATVKRSLTAGGGASKGGVARAVGMLLGLEGRLKPDATDALAVAVCHLFRKPAVPWGSSTAQPVSAWTRALAAAPPRPQTPQNALLAAALRRR